MAMGSSCPWTDHEKKVLARFAATISSLVMREVADSTVIDGLLRGDGRSLDHADGRGRKVRPRPESSGRSVRAGQAVLILLAGIELRLTGVRLGLPEGVAGDLLGLVERLPHRPGERSPLDVGCRHGQPDRGADR